MKMNKLELLINRVQNLKSNLSSAIGKTLTGQSDEIERLQKDQLWGGVTSENKDITPSYLEDPFFKNKAAATRYMLWKEEITPPSTRPGSIIPKRHITTPNLFIIGKFYGDLFSTVNEKRYTVNAVSRLGERILQKYNNINLLGLTKDNFRLLLFKDRNKLKENIINSLK